MPLFQLQHRRGTEAQWSSVGSSLVLASGELAIETDTRLFKLGDGVTVWNSLPYGGIQGFTGPTGFTGTQGGQGLQGLQGVSGLQGPAGIGAQGVMGVTGPQGVQGLQGLAGPGGAGPQGVIGVTGPQGVQGIQGVMGIGGPGPQGVIGVTGPQGVQGVQGLDGIAVTNVLVNSTGATSITVNWTGGRTYYLNGLTGSIALTITNMPLTANQMYTFTFLLVQGGTGHYISNLTLNSTAVTIRFVGNVVPTRTANVVARQEFTLYYSGSAWTALSEFTNFA